MDLTVDMKMWKELISLEEGWKDSEIYKILLSQLCVDSILGCVTYIYILDQLFKFIKLHIFKIFLVY